MWGRPVVSLGGAHLSEAPPWGVGGAKFPVSKYSVIPHLVNAPPPSILSNVFPPFSIW